MVTNNGSQRERRSSVGERRSSLKTSFSTADELQPAILQGDMLLENQWMWGWQVSLVCVCHWFSLARALGSDKLPFPPWQRYTFVLEDTNTLSWWTTDDSKTRMKQAGKLMITSGLEVLKCIPKTNEKAGQFVLQIEKRYVLAVSCFRSLVPLELTNCLFSQQKGHQEASRLHRVSTQLFLVLSNEEKPGSLVREAYRCHCFSWGKKISP